MTEFWQEIAVFFERVWAILLSFQVKDAFDILFVAALIYLLIRLVRDTRSMQLLKGLFWLILAWGVIKALHMNASEAIFRNLIDNFALLLLVLFQPEIRSLFESVGVGGFKLLSQKHDEESQIEAIQSVSEVFAQFSAERVGALVVFEHETMLGEIIKTGTMIEAKVSRQLVGNVFFPNAPMHDGAIVVREGVLVAAGCILPLSQSIDIDPQLGTRHRAAIGMSEQSDALIAVVSEETGSISLAYKGTLRRDLTPAELEAALTEALLAQEPVKKAITFFQRFGRRKAAGTGEGNDGD